MTFRKMPADGLPAWFPKPARSGVYIVRRGARIVYVGESLTGRLRKTLARHFQHWKGRTAGPTYPRASVEVAFEYTTPAAAVERQNRLIAQHRPADNTVGKPARQYVAPKRPAADPVSAFVADVFDALNPF
jgi:excinuclease UvrABC nuclease subunit